VSITSFLHIKSIGLIDSSYEDVESNTITHRASAEYKAFRAAVSAEGLLERPSDLRFWRPSSIGFLKRSNDGQGSDIFQETPPSLGLQYIVDELTPRSTYKDAVLQQLSRIANVAEQDEHVLSFWVLHRGEEEQDQDILVFSRYKDKSAWVQFCGHETSSAWEGVHALSDEQRRTTWVESELGFLGR
jgi:quinol monooxygenase YgiN